MNKAQELADRYNQLILEDNKKNIELDYNRIVKNFEEKKISSIRCYTHTLFSKYCLNSLIYYLEQNGFRCHHYDDDSSYDYDESYLDVSLPL